MHKTSKIFALLVALSLVLAACGSGGGAVQDEFSALAEFEGLKLDAGSCDYGGKVLSIEAVDELTVVFTLCKPDPAFEAKIAFTPFGIQPQEHIARTGGTGELLENPIGTGPYSIAQWDRGNQIVYTRFDDYWGETGAASTVTLRWLTEAPPACRNYRPARLTTSATSAPRITPRFRTTRTCKSTTTRTPTCSTWASPTRLPRMTI